MTSKRGFALVELAITMIAIGVIVIILAVIIKPAKILQKSRDSERFSDVNNLGAAVNAYLADNLDFEGLAGPYISIDPSFTNDQDRKKIDSTGWIPLDFNLMTNGAPLVSLPLDPLNDAKYHYTFAVSVEDKTYEINCLFENSENFSKASADGGNNDSVYEIGTDLTLI